MSQQQDLSPDDLFSRTWKTVVVLVGACVVFVGGLSATAVFVTNRAVAPATHESAEAKTDAKPAAATPAASPTAKKPTI